MKISKSNLKQIIKEEFNKLRLEYGDHETQASGGMVSSHYSSDPEMDQISDIAASVAEKGGQLLQVAGALKDESFNATLTMGVLMIDNKYLLGTADKFEIGPDDEVREAGPYVVGRL